MKRLKNPSLDVNVDPILAAIAGAVIVFGGGAAAYGATRDTEPRSPAPATAQAADPVVARALKIVSRTDGTVPAADADAAADEAKAAKAASAKGRGANPFPVTKAATTASAGGSSSAATPGTATNVASATPSAGATASASPASSSTAAAARAQATAASGKSDAANAAVQTATGGNTNAGTATGGSTTAKATGGGSAADAKAVARRLAAAKPAKVTLRVVSVKRRTTMNKRSLGLLVPGTTGSVARVVKVSPSNRVVTLRLRTGAALTGKQSPGTRCVERVEGTGACRLITVHTGNAAVIKAPKTPAGRPGAITALRVLSVWRGGQKVAD